MTRIIITAVVACGLSLGIGFLAAADFAGTEGRSVHS